MSACTACGVDLDAYRDEVTRLTEALDAAQDEIERSIADREGLREQVEDLRRRLADRHAHPTTWQGIGGGDA